MSPIAAKRTRSHTVANETAWVDDELPCIVSASEHSLSDSLHQRDDDDDDDNDDDKDDDDGASVPPLFETVFDANDNPDDADADADEEEVEEVDAAATMPHVHARTQAASTVGTCA